MSDCTLPKFKDSTKLHTGHLFQFGFEKSKELNNEDRLWIKDGITIYDSQDEGESFAYGTYVKWDGGFKGGPSIDTIGRLNELYHAFNKKWLYEPEPTFTREEMIKAFNSGFNNGRDNYTREYGDEWHESKGERWIESYLERRTKQETI